MGKNVIEPDKYRCRGYKMLLYPDNKQHMAVLHRLMRHKEYCKRYVGIWHVQYDKDGHAIVKGEGKKHAHIIVNHLNPVYWRSFNTELGFVDMVDGKPVVDYRFCMPVSVNIDSHGKFVKNGRASVERGLVYLTHADSPDKEQYTYSALWGAQEMIEQTEKVTDAYMMRNISMSECVLMVCDWINDQQRYIRWNEFVMWLCGTPYFKAQSSPIVRQVFDEHNRKWYRLEVEKQFSPRSGCSVFNLDEFKSIDDLPDVDDGGLLF